MSSVIRYDGKRVLVTGGASGMGAATVGLLADLGAEVFVLDIKEPVQPGVTYVPTDLRDPTAIDAAIDTIGGPVHSLFSCAGMPQTFPYMDLMLCNFCGPRHLIERVIPMMETGGSIAMIASIAGRGWVQNFDLVTDLVKTPDFDAASKWCEERPDIIGDGYSWSKMALVVYAKWKAPELIKPGIRINTISPGSTDTPMMPAFIEAAGKEAIDRVKSVAGRLSQPIEQAWPLVFINSDVASYINGEDLSVDGGFGAAVVTQQLG